jgi:succinate dehydrogenase (ubiquinone) membrane anchor subunit
VHIQPPSGAGCRANHTHTCPLCTCALQDSALQKAADWTLSLAVPLHMQITTNALVTDYVPTRFRGEQPHATVADSQLVLVCRGLLCVCSCVDSAYFPATAAGCRHVLPSVLVPVMCTVHLLKHRQSYSHPSNSALHHPQYCCCRCRTFAGPVRGAILGASLITYLGIMKVNLAGPGLTETVKTLWRKQPTPA